MRGAAAAPGTPGVCGRVPGTAGCPPPPGLRDGAESRGRMRFSFFFFFRGFRWCLRSCRRGSGSLGAARRAPKGSPGRSWGEFFVPSALSGAAGRAPRAGRERRGEPCPPPGSPHTPRRRMAGEGGSVRHTHTHTPETPIILSLTRCFCCPRLLTLQHSCQQASLRAQNPHAAPLPAPQPRTRQIEPCRCLGGGSGGDGGLGTARLSPARLGPARPGASRRGQARRRALGSDQAKGSCVALFPALRSPNV